MRTKSNFSDIKIDEIIIFFLLIPSVYVHLLTKREETDTHTHTQLYKYIYIYIDAEVSERAFVIEIGPYFIERKREKEQVNNTTTINDAKDDEEKEG